MPPRKWYTLDAETDPFVHGRTPVDFVWGVYDGSRFLHWWNDRDRFTEWLQDQDAIFYAHNGGRFDFFLLLSGDATPFAGKVSIINNRLVSLRFGKAELRDSWTLCPIPLGAYQKDEVDYGWFERETREQYRTHIVEYLYGDCRYLYELLQEFFKENPGFPLTLPSAAMKRLGKIQGIKPPKGNESFDEDMRGYYYGGRCQAFRKGAFPSVDLEILDINSAYPFVMQDTHWWGFHYEVSADLPSERDTLAVSMVSLRARSQGALPFRVPGEPLAFPDDSTVRTYHVTGHEVAAGLDTGTLQIEEVLEVRTPLETLGFAEYVAHFWEEKEAAERAGDQARRHIAKIMLNGAYGKFAQDPREFLDYQFADPEGEWYETSSDFYEIAGRFIVGSPSRLQRFYNVATAASITGAVRATLFRAIQNSSQVFYCDTDSIICERPGGLLVRGNDLGEWKTEGRVRAIAIGGRKLYAADLDPTSLTPGKKACKIASKGAKLTRDEVWEVARGGVIEWHSPAPTFSPRVGEGYFIRRRVKMT